MSGPRVWHAVPVSRARRGVVRVLAPLLAVGLLAGACGSSAEPKRPVLNWYVGADSLASRSLADSCSGGDVEVRIHELPREADAAHTALVRRLSSAGSSVDVLAIDGALVPEFAAAGWLRKAPPVAADILPAAAEQVTRDGVAYATAWLFDPQLLWYRPLTAERAGIDVTQPVTWDALLSGADRLGVTVQIADDRGLGLAEWVSALVAAGDGDVTKDLSAESGQGAASVIEYYEEAGVGPGPSPTAASGFVGSNGGFLIAPGSALSDPALAPLGTEFAVTAYPSLAGPSPAPARGVVLAVGAESAHPKEAAAFIECLSGDDVVRPIVTTSGYGPAKVGLLKDEQVRTALPTAAVLETAMLTARTVPVTPRWNAVRRVIDETWSPLGSVNTDNTPRTSGAAVRAALKGELP